MTKASSSIDLRPAKDASKTATNYISFTEAGGLDIGYTGDANTHGKTNIKADGMRIYDKDDAVNPVASFLVNQAIIGKSGASQLKLTSEGQSLESGKVKWLEIKKSGNPVADTYQYSEDCGDINHPKTTITLTKTPVAGSKINVGVDFVLSTPIRYQGANNRWDSHSTEFTAGTSSSVKFNCSYTNGTPATAVSNTYGTISYDATNNKITLTGLGSNVNIGAISPVYYNTYGEAVDLGTFSFGSRQNEDLTASGTASFGKGLTVSKPYQFVIGKYNSPGDYMFVIGNGSESFPRNVFTVDEYGNARVSGTVWHQGDGQYDVASDIKTSKGTLSSAYVNVYGKVAQLNITFKNTTAQATNVTVYTGTISKYKPKQIVNGIGSIQGHPLIGTLNSAGAIDIRNMHTSSVTVSSETRVTFTYVLA